MPIRIISTMRTGHGGLAAITVVLTNLVVDNICAHTRSVVIIFAALCCAPLALQSTLAC